MAEADDRREEALALVTARCEADGGAAPDCACRREAFRDEVLARATTPEIAVLAARIYAGDVADQSALLAAVQAADTDALTEAGILASQAAPRLESCVELAAQGDLAEEEEAETTTEGTADSARDRFIRQCAGDTARGICACIADAMIERLDPLEFELMIDLRAAEAEGEDAIAALAEERGLTVDEAKQALAQVTGSIAGAMMSIDPMACVDFGS